jgi:hypothetical protein
MAEYEVHWLIKELAATGADPQWVAEAIAIEQEVARAERVAAAALLRTQTVVPLRPRPQLRVVAAGPK